MTMTREEVKQEDDELPPVSVKPILMRANAVCHKRTRSEHEAGAEAEAQPQAQQSKPPSVLAERTIFKAKRKLPDKKVVALCEPFEKSVKLS